MAAQEPIAWREAVRECVDAFGGREKGYLDRGDLKCALSALFGLRPGRFELDQLLQRFGREQADGTVGVDKADAERVLLDRLHTLDAVDVARQMFCAFDVGCRGFLTFADALRCFREVMPSINTKVVLDAFRAADRDGDGRVGFGDFVRMLALP